MVENPPVKAGGTGEDLGMIPRLGRSSGLGNPLQKSCLENPHGQRSLAGSQRACTHIRTSA